MSPFERFKNFFGRKPSANSSNPKVGNGENPVVEYLGQLSKTIVAEGVSSIERNGTQAVITYGNPINRFPVRNSILGANLGRANTTKYSLVSDYDLARIERFYEKEGILRRFVVTATARAMRGEFAIVDNKAFTGSKKDIAAMKLAMKTMLNNSQTTWLYTIQTIFKELYTYGNTFIRKYRDKNGALESILSDDPLFYRVIIDPKTYKLLNYVRQPRLRPRAWSEDTWNRNRQHFGVYPQFVSSDYTGRRYMQSMGYYGSTILTAPSPETIALSDITHIRYMIEKNAPLAMPPGMPVLNDIEDMRVLEENLVFLGWQFGHPILMATVDCTGLTEPEANAEIARTRAAIENMESIGFIVGTHRLKVELKYPNGSGVPIDSFVTYLNKRISKNMDTAALLMGDGGDAGRQAGEAIEASSNDIIWMMCQIVKEKLEEEILRDVWVNNLGGGIVDELPLKIRLVEIDRTKYTAYVNQLNNLMNSLALPPSRVLDRIGELPLSAEEKAEIEEYAALKTPLKAPSNVNPQNQHGEQSPGSVKN